jgi:DNA-binding MarR family transcriptional regulator
MPEAREIIQDVIRWMEISTTRSMRDWGRYARETELSMPQFGILMRLYYRGGCGISEIGKHSGVTSAAVSQLVDRMVEKQLVERSEDPQDRRAKQLVLAPKGRELVKASIGARYLWVEDLVSNLTPEEREDVSKALPSLVRSLQKLDEVDGKDHPFSGP